MKQHNKLKVLLCLSLSVLMASGAPLTAFASAGEDPGTVEDSEKTFPDPDSFSYDDVEVNFATGIQYSPSVSVTGESVRR